MKKTYAIILQVALFAAMGCQSDVNSSRSTDKPTITDVEGRTCNDPSPCGDCDFDCKSDGLKNGNPVGTPISETTGVIETDEGITVDVQKLEAHFIWIANTEQGTVSKVDTRTYEELGRYISGPDGNRNDPSRTSVNSYGDVFVGNRSGQSVTKISSLGQGCADSNGDGVITTSTGPNDILPWGQDDCVLWNTRLNGDLIRAVAAQDVTSSSDFQAQKPGVWVGGWNGTIWKLDSDRGSIMLETSSPVLPYGFALDITGNLWIASRERAFGRLDTFKCQDNASCQSQVCGNDGDTCVKQKIDIETVPYGITVDYKQRVWLGGDAVTRYDRKQPLGSRLTYLRPSQNFGIWVHGIQADLDGNIWGSVPRGDDGNGVIRIDAENPNNHVMAATGIDSKGIAVDLDGKVWSINMATSDATVIMPGAELNANDVVHNVSGFVQPYTYSDMTGSQLRFATNQTGYFRQTFAGCPNTITTDWLQLRWDAAVPAGTSIRFMARGADTQNDLLGVDWHPIASVPGDISPLQLEAALSQSGFAKKKFLQVEAQLVAVREADGTSRSPLLRSMEITYHCGQGAPGFNNEAPNNETPNNETPNNNNGMCAPIGGQCSTTADCCSGFCSSTSSGYCIEN